jgi:cytochrome P450
MENELDTVDLISLDTLQNPFLFFAALREHSPVSWNKKYSCWLFTRYRDVKAALQDSKRFSSATGEEVLQRAEQFPPSARASFEIGYRFWYTTMLASDAPRHTEQRKSVLGAFTPRVIESMRSAIERRVDSLIDGILEARTCDFVSQFAYPLPSLIIFDLLGVPAEHYESIRVAAKASIHFPQITYNKDFKALEETAERLITAERIFQNLMEERRRTPKQDLISDLVQAQGENDILADHELVVLFNFLLTAGHETTANLLGESLKLLLEKRELWEQLKANPEIIPGAVEELLRFVSPILWQSRLLTENIELDGKILRKGERVMLGIGAANHDSNQYSEPETLKLTRADVHPLSFGFGPHYCLGAALARMEAQITLSKLVQRMPHVRLASSTFEYEPVYSLRALRSLPIQV